MSPSATSVWSPRPHRRVGCVRHSRRPRRLAHRPSRGSPAPRAAAGKRPSHGRIWHRSPCSPLRLAEPQKIRFCGPAVGARPSPAGRSAPEDPMPRLERHRRFLQPLRIGAGRREQATRQGWRPLPRDRARAGIRLRSGESAALRPTYPPGGIGDQNGAPLRLQRSGPVASAWNCRSLLMQRNASGRRLQRPGETLG